MKILLMCTANSCRSQMAEAWARRLFPADWMVQSAGLVTSPISIKTKEAMAEVGIDMQTQYSKPVDDFDLQGFDLVLTFSRRAAEFPPVAGLGERHLHVPVDDPTGLIARPDVVRAAYAETRDEIGEILRKFVDDHGGGADA